MSSPPLSPYDEQYVALEFERKGLFEALITRYACHEALYPGCSVHITPSFFIPHVIYVDQSPHAVDFFTDMSHIRQYVVRKKRYKRQAYIHFIPRDYTQPLELPPASFDLVLALYAGNVSHHCRCFLRPGGILVSNNHRHDVEDVIHDSDFRLIAQLQYHHGKYRFQEQESPLLIDPAHISPPHPDYLQNTSQGMRYSENSERYFIFQRQA